MMEDEGKTNVKSGDPKYRKLKEWVKTDRDSLREWREESREMYEFYVGRQWTDKERLYMEEQELRPAITFELVGPMVRAVGGLQSTNRMEVRYVGRGLEDDPFAEIWQEGGRWFHEQNDGADAEDDAFLDMCICGVGFTETRLDFDIHPDGEPVVERIDPFEMGWDHNARKKNLTDARRFWRAKDMTLGEAKDMFPDADPAKLDARWAREDVPANMVGDKRRRDEYDESNMGDDDDLKDDDVVTLVQIQWWEREPRRRTQDGRLLTPDAFEEEMDAAEQEALAQYEMMDPMMVDPQEVETVRARFKVMREGAEKTTERVYKQAWLGGEILEEVEAPFQKNFSFQAMTGYRDQNMGTFYGVVRAMIDPQRMANKWLSQMVHIVNVTAKGGVMIERDAFEDQRKLEESWAKAERVTVLNPNALAQGKVQMKPQAQFPQSYYEMTNFAVNAIRPATGITQELMGSREAVQAGILENMRKEQSMTTLAGLFKSLTQYRRRQGRVMLELMKNWVEPERLAKIVGDRFPLPIVQQAYDTAIDYDVIVDEMPTSPSQKAMVWELVSGIWANLDPLAQAELWEYSPLPASVAAKIKNATLAAYQQTLPKPDDVALDQAQKEANVIATQITNEQNLRQV